jgi:Flp pilus assembly protein TadD
MGGVEAKAKVLMARGDLAAAAEILRRGAIMQKTPNPRLLNLLGICEARQGHSEMAREVFNEALMVSPRNASALTNLGNLALLDGDHRAAREFYNRALRENLFLAEPRFNIVLSYQDMGHFEKAMTAYEEYVVMAKTSQWSRLILVAGVFLLLAFLLNR